jgi:thiosulfate/3-mercaptopyruvate sulfurtransferase
MTGGDDVGPLIDVDRLAVLLAAEPADRPIVCDVRFDLADHGAGRRLHAAGHIPGAVFVDLHDDLANPDGPTPTGGGRHPLPTPAAFGATLARLGIPPDRDVVAYDASGGAFAARLWWMLRAIGHRRVAVLDGGVQAWERAGHRLTAGGDTRPAAPVAGHEVPDTWPGVVSADEVAAASSAGRVLIDARAPERYRGEVEPFDRVAGHIPGAVNHFNGLNIGADGLHLAPSDLRRRLSDVVGDGRPIVYCGSGVAACHEILAMTLAGLDRGAMLYPGSWSEWSGDPGRPVATGDA